jgi:hypothetical protein
MTPSGVILKIVPKPLLSSELLPATPPEEVVP